MSGDVRDEMQGEARPGRDKRSQPANGRDRSGLSEAEVAVAGPAGTVMDATAGILDVDGESLAEIEEALGTEEGVVEVEETQISYRIRKPSTSKKRPEFFTTHPDTTLWVKAWLLAERLEIEENFWAATGAARGELQEHLTWSWLIPCLNSRGRVFIWPIAATDDNVVGRKNKWTDSALDAARQARTGMYKILADTDEGRYRTFRVRSNVLAPEWPADFNRATMLERAFRGRIIRDTEHEIAREFLSAGAQVDK
jgi:hypothetical protein